MRRKLRLYLDTSVPGAWFDPANSPIYKETKSFWERVIPRYEVFISDLVVMELAAVKSARKRKRLQGLVGNFAVLPVSEEAVQTARKYLTLLNIPEWDALHIAIASVEGMDFLVTWDWHCIARERTRRAIDYFNLILLLKNLVIYTPLDFIEESGEERKGKSRQEAGCFDTFESRFFGELHEIRKSQSREMEGLSPLEYVERIKVGVQRIRGAGE